MFLDFLFNRDQDFRRKVQAIKDTGKELPECFFAVGSCNIIADYFLSFGG